jgi:predicted DNA-binding protein
VENKKSVVLGIRLTPKIRDLVKKVSEVKGLTESELVRQLILEELSKYSLISTEIEEIKKKIREGEL